MCHVVLREGGEFKVRELRGGKEVYSVKLTPSPHGKVLFFDKVAEVRDASDHVYLRPLSDYHAMIDPPDSHRTCIRSLAV